MVVLDQFRPDFFRDLISKGSKASENTVSHFLLFFTLLVLEFLRRPDALLNAQPWSEDGPIFIEQALSNPLGSLVMSYRNYFHTIPRVSTSIAVQFGLSNTPLIMNFLALLISAYCMYYIFRPQFRMLVPNDLHRFLLAVFFVCLPCSEIFLTITNIQWFLLLFLTLWTTMVIFHPGYPVPGFHGIAEMLFAVMAFLSAPLGIILLPGLMAGVFLKLKANGYKLRSNSMLYLLPLIASAGYFIACSVRTSSLNLGFPPLIPVLNMIVSQIFIKLFLYNIYNLNNFGAYIFTLGIIAFLFIASAVRKDYKIDFWIIALFVLYTAIIMLFRPQYFANFTSLDVVVPLTRFLFYPMALVLILLFRHISTFRFSKMRIIVYVLLLLIFVNILISYPIPPFQDYQWRSAIEGYDPHGAMFYYIPQNPPTTYLKLPANYRFIQEHVAKGDLAVMDSNYVYAPNTSAESWENRFRYFGEWDG